MMWCIDMARGFMESKKFQSNRQPTNSSAHKSLKYKCRSLSVVLFLISFTNFKLCAQAYQANSQKGWVVFPIVLIVFCTTEKLRKCGPDPRANSVNILAAVSLSAGAMSTIICATAATCGSDIACDARKAQLCEPSDCAAGIIFSLSTCSTCILENWLEETQVCSLVLFNDQGVTDMLKFRTHTKTRIEQTPYVIRLWGAHLRWDGTVHGSNTAIVNCSATNYVLSYRSMAYRVNFNSVRMPIAYLFHNSSFIALINCCLLHLQGNNRDHNIHELFKVT